MTSNRIHWGLALGGGVLAELGVFAVMPVALRFGNQAPLYAIPPSCVVMTFVFGFCVARKAASPHFVLHGLLVGITATLIYLGITAGQPLPLAYVASHFLKVLGGIGGGLIAERQFKSEMVTGHISS